MEQNKSQTFWYLYVSGVFIGVIALIYFSKPSDQAIKDRITKEVDIPIIGPVLVNQTVKVEDRGLFKEAYDITGRKLATGIAGIIFVNDQSGSNE